MSDVSVLYVWPRANERGSRIEGRIDAEIQADPGCCVQDRVSRPHHAHRTRVLTIHLFSRLNVLPCLSRGLSRLNRGSTLHQMLGGGELML